MEALSYLLTIFTCLGSGYALAADMPVKYAAPAAIPAGPDWSGFVLGIQGGYGWATGKPDISIAPFTDPEPSGAVYGVFAGYNWNPGNWVVGLEIGYMQGDLKQSQSHTFPGEVPVTIGLHTKLDRLANANAKIGYLISPSILLYGTGGLAFGSAEATLTQGQGSITARGNHWGWDAGAGAEVRLAKQISLAIEYLHFDLGTAAYTATGFPPINAKVTADIVKAKLGYQF